MLEHRRGPQWQENRACKGPKRRRLSPGRQPTPHHARQGGQRHDPHAAGNRREQGALGLGQHEIDAMPALREAACQRHEATFDAATAERGREKGQVASLIGSRHLGIPSGRLMLLR